MRLCVREPLTANRTYYVRTDGNDNNTGLVNDAAGAFLTVQKAVNVVCCDIDMGQYSCVIEVGPGTYAENVLLRPYVGINFPTLRGDNTTPSNVTIAPAASNAIQLGFNLGASIWQIEGFKVTSATGNGIVCNGVAAARVRNIDFGACTQVHLIAVNGGVIEVNGNTQVSGGAFAHLAADVNGSIRVATGNTVAVTGTPAFAQAFVRGTRGGVLLASGVTFTGGATGKRYEVTGTSVADTGGGGANYFPGSVAGTTATGGEYL